MSNRLIAAPKNKCDAEEVQVYVNEYNHTLDQLNFPSTGTYIIVLTQPVVVTKTWEGNDYWVKPFGLVISSGCITNTIKGIDLSKGDIRLDSDCGYYNHPANNCRNYYKWLKFMKLDSYWHHSTPDGCIIRSHMDTRHRLLNMLKALYVGKTAYIKFEHDKIIIPKGLNIEGTVSPIDDFYERNPGTYVGYNDLRVRNTEDDVVIFGPYKIPEEEKEVLAQNKKNTEKLHKMMSIYSAAHPTNTLEEYYKEYDRLRDKYDLHYRSVPKHYTIIKVIHTQ